MRSFVLPGLLLLLIHTSASAQGILQVQIVNPAESTTSTGTLDVQVKITSTYQVDTVTAQVDTLSAPLQQSTSGPWTGSMDLRSLAWGAHTLTVRAHDVMGQTAEVSRSFKLDQPPVITLAQPSWDTAVNSTLHLEGSCQDDDPGGCSGTLEAQVVRYQVANSSEPVLASGGQSISASLDLSPFDDGQWWLIVRLRAADNTIPAFASRRIYVAKPPRYQFVGEAPSALIDFDSEHFLSVRDAEEFTLQRRDTGAIEQHYVLTGGVPDRDLLVGALTPKGALFRGKDARLYEWREGNLIDHGTGPYGPPGFIVQGNWVAIGGDLRHETTGHTWTPPYGIQALSPRGDVAADSRDPNLRGITLFRAGAVRKVADTSYEPSLNGYVRSLATDGYHFAWVEKPLERNDEVVYLSEGGTKQEIARAGGGFGTYPGTLFVNEGYVAFSKGSTDQIQVFLRRPDGVVQQLSFFSKNAVVEALGSTGEVMLDSDGRRYLGRPELLPLEIGPVFGRLKFYQGEWYLMAGRGLFKATFQTGERPASGPAWTPPTGDADSDTDGGTPGNDGGIPDDPGGTPEKPPHHSCATGGAAAPSLLGWGGVLVLLALRPRRRLR
ncbi:MAG: Ig-like domain-containing protein [Hyalangium sp.]|uniref:Ig-like domain-containing protein n=1 Tax=Hyalangium sp. TaxID=2028555 RepID=UPI00389A398B